MGIKKKCERDRQRKNEEYKRPSQRTNPESLAIGRQTSMTQTTKRRQIFAVENLNSSHSFSSSSFWSSTFSCNSASSLARRKSWPEPPTLKKAFSRFVDDCSFRQPTDYRVSRQTPEFYGLLVVVGDFITSPVHFQVQNHQRLTPTHIYTR